MNYTIIFVIGFPGSGKSTVARSIASALGAAYLDKDIICNGFTGLLLTRNEESADSRESSALYKEQIMPLEYQTLFNVANDTLTSSKFVVIDAPFISFFHQPDYLLKKCEQYNWTDVCLQVVEVKANLEVTKQRLIQRGEKRDLWKLDNWESFSERITRQSCHWTGVSRLSFDNSSPCADTVELINQIRQHPLKSDNKN
ncbi:AAA family ATPase [Marinomonas algicola]|uniref:AAA family ATPase n=1 Tax=Marinomonas algicola TaxID=2773454 RepID=UPI001748734E|nr:ATP-binding protein [Marinomonas algicola]